MDDFLPILITLAAVLLASPLAIRLIQRLRFVRRLEIEDEVARYVPIAVSAVERWALARLKSGALDKPASADKLARARELVRAKVGTALPAQEIEAHIEHELEKRAGKLGLIETADKR